MHPWVAHGSISYPQQANLMQVYIELRAPMRDFRRVFFAKQRLFVPVRQEPAIRKSFRVEN